MRRLVQLGCRKCGVQHLPRVVLDARDCLLNDFEHSKRKVGLRIILANVRSVPVITLADCACRVTQMGIGDCAHGPPAMTSAAWQ
eukprot:6484015-Amphidinium_carterae.1